MQKVSDITSEDVGKLLRVQTNDGAYIEGTLTKITHELPSRTSAIVQTTIEFRELYITNSRGESIPYAFITWGNRNAREIDEEEQYHAG